MRLVSRDFTFPEKVILLVLSLILIGIAYYRFIDQPVREGIEEAEAQCDKLQVELNAINARIDEYNRRVAEIGQAKEIRRYMSSYNASDEELRILNGVLGGAGNYSFEVDKITLSGNQIRRNFTLAFRTHDFETAKGIFTRLSNSHLRCMIDNVEYSGVTETPQGVFLSVRANGAFYETLVDAKMDAVLGEVLQEQGRSEIPTSKSASEKAAA